jgi:cold shock CspA family protein
MPKSTIPEKQIGIIRTFDSKKKTGALTSSGDFYIVNVCSALRSTVRQLQANQRVSFQPSRSPEGLLATDIEILEMFS